MAAHVTLAGDLNGDDVVDERLADGRLVIRPGAPAARGERNRPSRSVSLSSA
jgi:hypothetical protein